ncbi:MAG: hypothetical protein OXC08_20680 [Thiotrichales bacterium]|nr:hypothetical protein [Thiotrichales bacterium]
MSAEDRDDLARLAHAAFAKSVLETSNPGLPPMPPTKFDALPADWQAAWIAAANAVAEEVEMECELSETARNGCV